MSKDIKWDDLYPEDRTIVRHNMLTDITYTPYCGSVIPGHPNYKICHSPRTVWDKELNQMRCPNCGWASEFPADFIVRYKDAHGLE